MNVAIVNCFDTYEHRVELLYNFFKANGDNVRVYTSDFRHIEKVKRTDDKKDYIFIESMPYMKNISPQRLYSHHKTAKDLFKRLGVQKIDLLWVLVPPNSFVKEAAKYKIKHSKVKLIFDIIDMWPETMPLERFEKIPVVGMWKNLRDNWLDYADYVVTECDLFQEKLKGFIKNEKMSTIYLAREIVSYKGNPMPPDNKIALCYLGSINNIIDIPTISQIINEARNIKPVVLHIIGDGENRCKLIEEAKQAGAEVRYHGKVYDSKKKQDIFDSCHYGLNIMKSSVYVGLTMKSMDYFEAGLPIINNIYGDTWDAVCEKKIGVNIDNLNFSNYNYLIRENVRLFFEKEFSILAFENKLNIVMKEIFI